MYFWIAVVASAIGFGLWIWYELAHALEVDDDGNPIFKCDRTLFDEEHDEAMKFREQPNPSK